LLTSQRVRRCRCRRAHSASEERDENKFGAHETPLGHDVLSYTAPVRGGQGRNMDLVFAAFASRHEVGRRMSFRYLTTISILSRSIKRRRLTISFCKHRSTGDISGAALERGQRGGVPSAPNR
jgi:hypothetical protein